MDETIQKIIEILEKYPGIRARIIAALLGINRSELNRILYGNLGGLFVQDSNWGWFNNGKAHSQKPTAHPSIISWINTMHGIIGNLIDADEDVFAYNSSREPLNPENTLYYLDCAIVTYIIDLTNEEEDLPDFIDISNVEEVYKQIGGILDKRVIHMNMDYFDGFYTRSGQVPVILWQLTQWDKKYNTRYAEAIVDCFMGLGIAISLESSEFVKNDKSFDWHVGKLLDYIRNIKDEQHQCDYCGDFITGLSYSVNGVLVCRDCISDVDYLETDEDEFNSIIDDDIDEEDDETEEEIDETDVVENRPIAGNVVSTSSTKSSGKKQEIIEDCRTCIHKSTCSLARFNRVCERYLYKK